MAKTLYHLCTDENDQPQEGVFVDGNGHKYTIPYDEPVDIESDFMALKIIEHLHYFGLVEVFGVRSRTGIVFDMADARRRALECLEVSESQCVNEYIQYQLEDRVRKNFPPMAPAGRALQCVVKRRVNLLKYGLRPIGWNPPYEVDDPTPIPGQLAAPSDTDQRLKQLEQTISQQQGVIIQLLQGKRADEKEAREAAKDAKAGKAAKASVPAADADESKQSVTL